MWSEENKFGLVLWHGCQKLCQWGKTHGWGYVDGCVPAVLECPITLQSAQISESHYSHNYELHNTSSPCSLCFHNILPAQSLLCVRQLWHVSLCAESTLHSLVDLDGFTLFWPFLSISVPQHLCNPHLLLNWPNFCYTFPLCLHLFLFPLPSSRPYPYLSIHDSAIKWLGSWIDILIPLLDGV